MPTILSLMDNHHLIDNSNDDPYVITSKTNMPIDVDGDPELAEFDARLTGIERMLADLATTDQRVQDLAMLVRILVSTLKKYWPHAPHEADLLHRAISYLRTHDLMGSPLRDQLPEDVQ